MNPALIAAAVLSLMEITAKLLDALEAAKDGVTPDEWDALRAKREALLAHPAMARETEPEPEPEPEPGDGGG